MEKLLKIVFFVCYKSKIEKNILIINFSSLWGKLKRKKFQNFFQLIFLDLCDYSYFTIPFLKKYELKTQRKLQ